jgi:hypothetical protein
MRLSRKSGDGQAVGEAGSGGAAEMVGLKAPSILTFMISVIMVVVVIIAKFFEASIPLISGREFYVLLAAHVLLVLGCMFRAL